jgi:hypothetical protein
MNRMSLAILSGLWSCAIGGVGFAAPHPAPLRPAPGPVGPTLSVTALYEGRLLVKVLDVRTDQIVEPSGFRLGARVHTSGAVGAIKAATFLAQAQGPMTGAGPLPSEFISNDGKRRRVVRFNNGSARSPADPLTQLLRMALTPGSASPCLGALRVEDGRQTYDLIASRAGGGKLTGQQTALGLGHAERCALGFRPVAGFKPGASLRNPFMTGDLSATFARSTRADVWVLADLSIGTVLGQGHIGLTGLSVSGARPAAPLPGAAPTTGFRHRR